MRAVILAGGLGTRLREHVPDLPKPMAPVAGRPFLEYLLDRLIVGGVSEIILSVGYRAEVITAHFGQSYRNAAVSYAVETEPLGTGGAILHALRGKGNAPSLVLNGDTLLNLDYRELIDWYEQDQERAQVAMVLRQVAETARFGAVLVTGGHVAGIVGKGKVGAGLINAGVYVVRPGVFEAFGLRDRFSFEADLLQRHCAELLPRAFLTNAYFIDIGIPEDYDRAQYELPAIA